jgi:hypothetical protein
MVTVNLSPDQLSPGLVPALEAAGLRMWVENNVPTTENAGMAAAIETFVSTYDPLPDTKAAKLAELAEYRWERETGGITVNGLPVYTDDRSKLLLNGARSRGQGARWKTTAGFVHLTAEEVEALAQAVAAHVQACFDREAELTEQIEALTDWQAVAAFDITTGWP